MINSYLTVHVSEGDSLRVSINVSSEPDYVAVTIGNVTYFFEDLKQASKLFKDFEKQVKKLKEEA